MSLKYNLKNDSNRKTYVYFNPTTNNNLEDIKLLLENYSNIQLYNGTNPDNEYNNVCEYIIRIINNSEFLCKGLNPDYVSDSFETADAIIIIGSSSNILPNGNVYGFASINFDESTNSIYIDVICSHIGIKGAGDILINEIENISKVLLINKITLTSVKSAITFYEKYGFVKKDNLCNNMCLMTKYIKKIGGKRKTNKIGSRNKKATRKRIHKKNRRR